MTHRILLAASVLALASTARASTGVCDSNPPTSTQACIDAIQSAGTVVNDIFRDANGRDGTQLPVYGKLINNWPQCGDVTNFDACATVDAAPYDCPPGYSCATVNNDYATAQQYLAAPDHLSWQPCRLLDDSLHDNGSGVYCPVFGSANCAPDGTPGLYDPWEGLVFDLGGPSNRVAIFAENDHGPQPCESLEYTVFLTDNPYATDEVLHPATDGVDPQKWNRAVLSKIYTWGWFNTRAPDPTGHSACGDTADYAVEDDSFTQVFSLPCGITFRYASVVAGNDGLDFPACGYDSQEAELDAVAGLTEGGAAVCPDADGDHFVDCNCPGAPSVCDCNDNDPNVHPGAPETCDSPDLNCDGVPGSCAGATECYQHQCLNKCDASGELTTCPQGSTCASTSLGQLCVPQDCTAASCPAGSTCTAGACVPSCDGVVCPVGQTCETGLCVDPCQNITCPPGQTCAAGTCQPPCSCFAPGVGCANQPGTLCDVGGTNQCVAPNCQGLSCPSGQQCDPATGQCSAQCTASVVCPLDQKCLEGQGCVPLCTQVACPAGDACDPADGTCKDPGCVGVECPSAEVCSHGHCVAPDAGHVTTATGTTGGGSTGTGTTGGTSGASSGSSGSHGASASGSTTGSHNVTSSGCGCGAGSTDASLLAVCLGALALVGRRKR
ncbi:MAG: putative metal-binding motif-containing protein [Deltaproteobacteria bacterium]|nr:putative metal-binding motif-containing protein [Deltaproteobacteria bacterium]